MPGTYDKEDQMIELKQELDTADDNLKAEYAAHGATMKQLHAAEERMARIASVMRRNLTPANKVKAVIRILDTANAGAVPRRNDVGTSPLLAVPGSGD